MEVRHTFGGVPAHGNPMFAGFCGDCPDIAASGSRSNQPFARPMLVAQGRVSVSWWHDTVPDQQDMEHVLVCLDESPGKSGWYPGKSPVPLLPNFKDRRFVWASRGGLGPPVPARIDLFRRLSPASTIHRPFVVDPLSIPLPS